MPLLAETALLFDPIWPWSLPGVGVPALIAVAGALTVLTVLTYLVGRRASFRQFAAVLALRLAALGVVYLLMLRPALAVLDTTIIPSKLLLLIDASQSMSISDELNHQSRWEAVLRLLQSETIQSSLEQLQRDKKIEMVYYQGGADVAKFDPEGKADGERTNMGRWLNVLLKRHGTEPNLRGLVLLSDGADNDSQFSVIEEAKHWRGLHCPVQTFGLGSPTTAAKQHDIYFVPDKIFPTPSPVPIKSKLTVRGVVNAPGLEGGRVALRVLLNDKEVSPSPEWITLHKTADNEVSIVCDAPADPGEYKVTLRIDPQPGEVSKLNNEISTYITATKEGISILWVEGKKRLESTFILKHALSRDPRFRVYYAEKLNQAKPAPEQDRWFDFDKRRYDVIVLGDISPERLAGDQPGMFAKLQELVRDRGTGLLMLGGYETFTRHWQQHPEIARLLPVKMDQEGQIPGPIKIRPTEAGFDHYIMRLADDPTENLRRWETLFTPLDGMTRLGTVRDTATVLATRSGQEPLLVSQQFGAGRTLAFGGDTTWKAWRRSYEAIDAYDRFWKRAMLWLARQEEVEGNVWVKLDSRRLPAGGSEHLGLEVGLRSKSGQLLAQGNFQVKVVGPRSQETDISIFPENGKLRGSFWKTAEPGEYTVLVKGSGKDEQGREISGTARARFLVYAVDLENLKPAANHELLARIATAGGGEFRLAGERDFQSFLNALAETTAAEERRQADVWPDWKRAPASSSLYDQVAALWSSGTLLCYFLFCSLLCTEWYLRRRWKMV